MADENLPDNVRRNLELQLSEVEMLRSMFPSQQEFFFEDDDSVSAIQAFVDGTLQYEFLFNRIGFVICLAEEKGVVEVICHLPHEYPIKCPDIFTRLPSCFSRESQRTFSDHLHAYMRSITSGDLSIGLTIQWIKENMNEYLRESPAIDKAVIMETVAATFVRLWVKSHHIFSKFKRRDIIDIASELRLTGFSVPGKPGLICVEGDVDDVEEFWSRIRRMSWKKIAVKEREEVAVASGDDLMKLRKFVGFEEKAFDVRGGKGREYHMDLGEVYTFLESVGCRHIFVIYFGVEGQSSTQEKGQ